MPFSSHSIVLDYYAFDPYLTDRKDDDYSQFGTIALSPRPIASEVPGTASVKFDVPFEEIPNVFAQVSLGTTTSVYPFIVTVSSISETHMELSYVCTGHIILSSFGGAEQVYEKVDTDSSNNYYCTWSEYFSIDWRAWPVKHTEWLNGTEIVTNGGSPYHAFTSHITPSSTSSTSLTKNIYYSGVQFDKQREVSTPNLEATN